MSRIGKQPIAIPPKVKVEVTGQQVLVEGPKGKLNWELPKPHQPEGRRAARWSSAARAMTPRPRPCMA